MRLRVFRFNGHNVVATGQPERDLGGHVYYEFSGQELKNERAHREALDARAIAVITTSGSFVALSFAIITVATKLTDYRLSNLTTALLSITTLALCLSALFALLASRLEFYLSVTPQQLVSWTDDEFWLDEEDNAKWLLTQTNSRTLESLRIGNQAKANRLSKALWAQLIAFCLLAACIIVVLFEQI